MERRGLQSTPQGWVIQYLTTPANGTAVRAEVELHRLMPVHFIVSNGA